MAWPSFSSPSAANFNSYSEQSLSYEAMPAEEHATDDPFTIFPHPGPCNMDECIPSDYRQAHHSDCNTAQASPYFLSRLDQTPFHGVLTKHGDFEYIEKDMFSGPHCSRPHTSISSANGPSIPKTNQDRRTTREVATHRVAKRKCGALRSIMLFVNGFLTRIHQ